MRAPLLGLMLLATAGAGCASARPVAETHAAIVARGQSFAERACAGCHSVGHAGESPNPHAPPFRVIAAQRSDARLGDALSEISRNGHLEMPPIYVTPDEMTGVVAYMRSLTGRAT